MSIPLNALYIKFNAYDSNCVVAYWIQIPEPPIVMATKGGDDYDIG